MRKKFYNIPTARYIKADNEEMIATSFGGGGLEPGELDGDDVAAKKGFALDFSDEDE